MERELPIEEESDDDDRDDYNRMLTEVSRIVFETTGLTISVETIGASTANLALPLLAGNHYVSIALIAVLFMKDLTDEQLQHETKQCKYSEWMGPPEQSECMICLDHFEPDNDICILKCKHIFHLNCGYTWLRKKKTCPLCRMVIDTELTEQDLDFLFDL